ncbi:MAG: hypothetical protein AAFQ63_07460 [Cyanobacteria bacterium J06621_11]
MPKYPPILLSIGLSHYPIKRSHSIERTGLKSLSITGLVCLLSMLSQQPVGGQQSVRPSLPVVVESRAHYRFTASDGEHLGASGTVTIERSQDSLQSSEGSSDATRDTVNAVGLPTSDFLMRNKPRNRKPNKLFE